MALQRLGCPSLLQAAGIRRNSTLAGTLYYRINYHNKEKLALRCPKEKVEWSYEELWGHVQRVAGGLQKAGYRQGTVIATDLENTVSNIVLQLAVAHNGMSIVTVKSKEEMEQIGAQVDVSGAVMSSGSSFLSSTTFPIPNMEAAALAKLAGKAIEGATERDYPHAFYSSGAATTNREIYLYGVGTAGTLEMEPDDMVCVASSLNTPFGMGGVISAFTRNSAVYLPDLKKPDLNESTILITDADHVASIRGSAPSDSKLRGGIVKTGPVDSEDYDLLNKKEELAGAQLWTLGSGDDVFRPLFDACVDKYYAYK
jgi:hypothetical protein